MIGRLPWNETCERWNDSLVRDSLVRDLQVKAAVVVVTYQSSADIQSCLDSFASDPLIGSIVVVDSGSPDVAVTLDIVGKYANVRFEAVGSNIGFGAACNRGVANTTEQIVVLLNPDTELAPGCISALVLAMQRTGSERTAVIGPIVTNPDGTVYPSARVFPSIVTSIVHGFVGIVAPKNRFSEKYLRPDRPPEWISGTAMAVRRSAFESVGGFDEQFFMYVEDVDLCWRLAQRGWGVAQITDAVVTHHIGGSSKHRRFGTVVEHHRSLWRFAIRQSSGLSRFLLPIVAVGLMTRCAVVLIMQTIRKAPAATRHG
jgi:N-acetylglucosaminyl-diphospho-decaprenol L-rhamnosyltransferase